MNEQSDTVRQAAMERHQRRELDVCQRSFVHWCEKWAWIEDKESGRPLKMHLFPCQRLLAEWLQARHWLRILKARRLGVTWLCALYAVWLMVCFKMKTVGFVVHKVRYAQDFIDYCKFVLHRLPDWMRPVPVTDNRGALEFESQGMKSWIKAVAATVGAADSIAADVFIVDQAPQIEDGKPGLLKTILRSVSPTVETARGNVIQIGTSIGPTGYFHEAWEATDRDPSNSRYRNVFWSWRERPGRDDDWYEQETEENKSDPLHMPRNYPETPDEAFSIAEGRVYPTFRKSRHVLRFGLGAMPFKDDDPMLPGEPVIDSEWPCWRGVDWGGRDPHVCLWTTMIPNLGPGLSIDPSCKNLIREMMSYRYRPDSGVIEDRDDHGPDCLRYLITTFSLHNHVHIYRELYIFNPADNEIAVPHFADQIVALTGENEYVRMTVCDRYRASDIVGLRQHMEKVTGRRQRCVPHTAPLGEKSRSLPEKEQGIDRVNTLIIGTKDIFVLRECDPFLTEYHDAFGRNRTPAGVAISMELYMREKSLKRRMLDRHRAAQRRPGGRGRRMR